MDRGAVRQYTAAFIGSLTAAAAGQSYGWVTPLLARLRDPAGPLPLTADQSSWAVALVELGNLFTSLPAGLLADRCGRKRVLLATAPAYALTWSALLATRSVGVLYAVRAVQGLAMGAVYAVLPVYLAEIAEPARRGALSAFFEAAWYLGILIEYCAGPFLSYDAFTALTLALPLALLLALPPLPESPYFLLARGRDGEALRALGCLRGCAPELARGELAAIGAVLSEEREQNRSWRSLFSSRADVRALLIVQVVVLTKFMSGIAAVLSYSSDMFASTSASAGADRYTIAIGVVLLVTTVLAGGLVDTAGRRPLLLVSCVGSGVAEFVAGLYCLVDARFFPLTDHGWIFVAAIMAYCFIFSLGLGPLVNTLKGEIFPTSTKGIGSGLTTVTDTVSCFVCLKMYQAIKDSYGVYLNFWIFSFFSFLGAVLVYFLVPETKGKSFSEIQQTLGYVDAKGKRIIVELESLKEPCKTEEC